MKKSKLKKKIKGLQDQIDEMKAQKCECSNSSIIDPNRPKEADSPMIDFRDAVAFHYANAVGKSVIDYIKTNPDKFKSGIIEKKKTDTDTQKEDKNPVEVKQTAKKECIFGRNSMDKLDIRYLRIGYIIIALIFLIPILALIYLAIAFICNSYDAFSWHWIAKTAFVLISISNVKIFASITIKQYYIAKGKLNA